MHRPYKLIDAKTTWVLVIEKVFSLPKSHSSENYVGFSKVRELKITVNFYCEKLQKFSINKNNFSQARK